MKKDEKKEFLSPVGHLHPHNYDFNVLLIYWKVNRKFADSAKRSKLLPSRRDLAFTHHYGDEKLWQCVRGFGVRDK